MACRHPLNTAFDRLMYFFHQSSLRFRSYPPMVQTNYGRKAGFLNILQNLFQYKRNMVPR